LEPAAASLGASPARVLVSVVLPLLRPAVGSALLFAFLVAFDDVIVGLFLSGPGAVTLAVRMWEDIRLEISPRIAAVSVLFLATAVLAAMAMRVQGRWSGGGHGAERL
jgi:ABC-type spermidine/putrescine transport system permease subunit II